MSIETKDTTSRAPQRSWLAAGVASTVAVLAVGGLFVWMFLAGEKDPSTETTAQTYAREVGSIEVDLFAGNVTVAVGEIDEVVVERRLHWKDTKPTHTEEFSGDTLRIVGDCPGDPENCRLDYTLRVPADVALDVTSGSGDVEVSGVAGTLRLDTVSGDVTIDQTAGDLWVRNLAGNITGTSLGSAATEVDSESGNLDLRYTAPPETVRAETESGDVDITVPTGDDSYDVQAETEAGEREVTVRQDPDSPHAITATTESGDVDIRPN